MDEVVKVICLKGSVLLGGIMDICLNVKCVKIGSMLSLNELFDIVNMMYGSCNMKCFIEDMVDNGVEFLILEIYVV